MGDHLTSAREALMAELLQDVDTLLKRLEHVHEALPGLIEQATKDAAGKAFLAARLNLESVIDQQSHKLTDAGRHAAALIGNQLTSEGSRLVSANEALASRARALLFQIALIALLAGAIGGFIGAKFAGV